MMLSELVSLDQCIERLKVINVSILKGRLERGNILRNIKENKGYLNFDGYVENWDSFVEAIGINRETARQDMDIFEQFSFYILGKKEILQNCSYERLVRLLPIVKKKPQMKIELLEMATNSNRADFNNNIRELKGLTPADKCVDVSKCDEPSQIYEKCMTCNAFIRREDLEC
ncbi:hypothetical protein KY313_03575 [Candidatus Woesearchaeota archaeon]|nr:hypothetical protein [Candidatus Woesearchaeota archaeon]